MRNMSEKCTTSGGDDCTFNPSGLTSSAASGNTTSTKTSVATMESYTTVHGFAIQCTGCCASNQGHRVVSWAERQGHNSQCDIIGGVDRVYLQVPVGRWRQSSGVWESHRVEVRYSPFYTYNLAFEALVDRSCLLLGLPIGLSDLHRCPQCHRELVPVLGLRVPVPIFLRVLTERHSVHRRLCDDVLKSVERDPRTKSRREERVQEVATERATLTSSTKHAGCSSNASERTARRA